MQVCVEKLTGKLIESQSGGDQLHPHQIQKVITEAFDAKYKNEKVKPKKTLEELVIEFAPELEIATKEYRQFNLNAPLQNAINQGYKEEDVEVKFVTDAEFQVIMEAQPKPEPTEEQINEEKIQAKTRELAIQSLKASGNLPKDYK